MKYLEMKWTVSRGRDTHGWNIATLIDGKDKYKTCGGGYDMQGSVFGKWLMHNYRDKLIKKIAPYDENNTQFYGFYNRNDKYYLDGSCGLESMISIAKEIGLEVKKNVSAKGQILGFMINEVQ